MQLAKCDITVGFSISMHAVTLFYEWYQNLQSLLFNDYIDRLLQLAFCIINFISYYAGIMFKTILT